MHFSGFIVIVRVLILNALYSLFELLQTFRGPPVLFVAMEIVFPARIVEPVGDLVAQNCPNRPKLEYPGKNLLNVSIFHSKNQ